jgi:hypothetical protein
MDSAYWFGRGSLAMASVGLVFVEFAVEVEIEIELVAWEQSLASTAQVRDSMHCGGNASPQV